MEEFEYYGEWWIPQFSEPKFRVAGILRFHPTEGGTLELLGDDFGWQAAELFSVESSNSAFRILTREDFDFICGFTAEGKPATLHMCAKITSVFATGYNGAKFQIGVIFIGCLFEKDEDLIFDSILVNYSHLKDWLRLTGFDGKVKWPEGSHREVNINYKTPTPVELELGEFNITFSHRLKYSPLDPYRELRMEEAVFAGIKPIEPLHYDLYQEKFLYYFRNFLCLALDTVVVPRIVFGVTNTYQLIDDEDESDRKPKEIRIYYRAKGADIISSDGRKADMLFSYPDMAENAQTYLKQWFEKAEKLRIVHDLFFGITYIPKMYIHMQLLTLAQAIEAYHRRQYSGQYLTEAEYEPIRESLENAIPPTVSENHRVSLKGTIKYGYEYSLRKRLKLILQDVLKNYSNIVEKLYGDKKAQGIFIDRLVNARNDFTHYPEDMEDLDRSNPREMVRLVEKTELLVKLCLLAEMGFSSEIVEKITSHNRKFQEYLDI